MQSGRRREHATALISELLRTLSEDEPLLSEQERTRMADLCNIYSLNRSQTRQLLLQVKDLRANSQEESQPSANRQSTREVAIQTESFDENSQTSAGVIRKLLAQLQSAKRDACDLNQRLNRLLKEKEQRERFMKSLMDVNTVQTQVIAGLKDSIGKFTGMLKTRSSEKQLSAVPANRQCLENIAVDIKPQKKSQSVQAAIRNPLSEIVRSINIPHQATKSEKDRLRDKILSRIKHRRTSHQSSTATLPQEHTSIPQPFTRMHQLYSVDIPSSETPHFRSNNRKCSLGNGIDRLKTEPDRPSHQNIFL